jgi:hypothetical protein
MTVDAAIMHVPVPERVRVVERLVRELEAEGVSVVVVEDPDREGPWPTRIRALRAPGPGAVRLLLQDDAIPHPRFMHAVRAIVGVHRDRECVSLYTGRARACARAVALGARWMWSDDALHGLAFLWPRAWTEECIEWNASHVRDDYIHDDDRIGLWLRATGRGVWIPVPQLFDHARVRSLLGHRWTNYEAHARYDGSEIDWSHGVDRPHRIGPTVRARRALIDPSEVSSWPPSRF